MELTEEQKNNTDLNKIPDICLWRNRAVDEDHFENLVVEIKRPQKVLGQLELNQIKNYAYAVSKEPGFDKEKTKWHFVLLGNDFDDRLAWEMKNKKNGIYFDEDNIKIVILKWSSLINENKIKYSYIKDKTQLAITNEDIAKALNEKWSRIAKKSD